MPSHLFSRVGLWRERGDGNRASPASPAGSAWERVKWTQAAALDLSRAGLSWSKFPQAEAILVFARGLGAARSGDVAAAHRDAERLRALKEAMTSAKIGYWAGQADFQSKTGDAPTAVREKRAH